MDEELVASLAVSLAVGLLIGLERQRAITVLDAEGSGRGSRMLLGGVRTFPLIALAGSAAVLLEVTPWALVAMVALVAVHRLALAPADREAGLTTEIAAVVTFLLGALAVSPTAIDQMGHRLMTVAALAVVVTLLLNIKPRLHAVVRRISDEDLFATVQLLVVAVVVLPLLPDRGYGPWNAINPRTIGLMILFVGAVSFVGYAANRMLGPGRGLAVAGLVGGLVSSTAVTFSMSRRVQTDPRVRDTAALAVVTASSMMFPRVLVVVLVVRPALAAWLVAPCLVMGLAGGGAAWWLWRRAERGDGDGVELKNPFELKSAVVFGLIYAVVTFAAKAVRAELGDAVLPLAGAVAGLTDLDAITLSTANMATLSPVIASTTIFVACLSNTAVKAGIALVSGGLAFGGRIAAIFGVMAVAGTVALVAQRLLW